MTTPYKHLPRKSADGMDRRGMSRTNHERMNRRQEIRAIANRLGGRNREFFDFLGVPWPPRKGWFERLLRGERRVAINQVPPTLEQIEAAQTPAGGWDRETLRQWGVAWPPQKGWKQKLIKRRRSWEREREDKQISAHDGE